MAAVACGGGADNGEGDGNGTDTSGSSGTAGEVSTMSTTAGPSTSTASATTNDPTTGSGSSDDGSSESTTSTETTGPPPGDPGSLQFFGNGGLYDDRVLIMIDDPMNADPGPPLDVGNDDFTIEFWIRPDPEGNPNPAISCGNTNDWVTSNIIVDRDRHSQPPSYGVGIAGGVIVWAVQGEFGDPWSMCGTTNVLDDEWHHIAVQRRRNDGWLWLYVDGNLDADVDGPDGDVSYPDDGEPMDVCPAGLCDYSDPFLSLGAEKHGYGGISYAGFFDELRVSTTLRYTGDTYDVPTEPLTADGDTVGLYHFGEGEGAVVGDSSPNMTDGQIQYGGNPPGPVWSAESPF